MQPIWIILYAVLVTLLLTLFVPRLKTTSSGIVWFLVAAGVLGLIALVVVVLAL